jgi:GT2 family glycosyltransferase
MDLSVIIVNYNQKYFPKMCLEALLKSKTNFLYEIIFVDNHSHDESIEFLKQKEKEGIIKLVRSGSNLGYGQANNLGKGHARGEYLLFRNPDVFVSEGTLQTMLDYMKKHDDVAILGPRIVYHNGKIQESCRRFMTFTDLVIKRTFLKHISPFKRRLKHYIMKDFDHNRIQDVDLLVGACFMFRKDIFEKLDGFDKRYFLFMEDFDLCQKAHAENLRVVYFPHTTVTHFHKRLSEGSIFRLLFQKVFWYHLISSSKYFWRWRHIK